MKFNSIMFLPPKLVFYEEFHRASDDLKRYWHYQDDQT
jgi:hypothetical protein